MQEVNADKYEDISIVLDLQSSFLLSYSERNHTKNQ